MMDLTMFQITLLTIIFLTGLIVGSFLNCVIYRLESQERPVLRLWRRTGLLGRSHCPHCGHILAWYDLIPVLSFLILKGKCSYCGKKISWQYPLVEIATGLLFLLIFNFKFDRAAVTLSGSEGSLNLFEKILAFARDSSSLGFASLLGMTKSLGFASPSLCSGLRLTLGMTKSLGFASPSLCSGLRLTLGMTNSATILFYLVISCFLILIFVYDLKHYIIPDKIIYPAIAITLIYRFFEILKIENWCLIENWKLEIENFQPLLNPLTAAFLASLFFLSMVVFSRGKWMGLGDVKLAFLMGLILGWPNILVALFFAFFIGAIIGIGLIALKKRSLKSEVPFGPFLITSTFIAMFWGERIVGWYISLFT